MAHAFSTAPQTSHVGLDTSRIPCPEAGGSEGIREHARQPSDNLAVQSWDSLRRGTGSSRPAHEDVTGPGEEGTPSSGMSRVTWKVKYFWVSFVINKIMTMVLIYPDAIETEQDQIRQCMYQRTTMNPHSFSYCYNYHKVQSRSESLVVFLSSTLL